LDSRKDLQPGPGQYSPDANRGKKASPRFGFGTDERIKNLNKFNTPGPNSYEINDKLARKTFSSWGMGYGKKMNPAEGRGEGPGPGSYEPKSFTSDGKKYGIGGKKDMFKIKRSDNSPGPGQYAPDGNKVKNAAPNFGFGTEARLRTAGKRAIPDPGTYKIKDDFMRTTQSSWSMGYGTKIDLSKTLADTPGPGSYELKSNITDGKKYGIGGRTDMFKLRKDQSPGPGQYKHEIVDLKKSSQSYKWGKDDRFSTKHIKGQAPGPGNYGTNGTLGGPQYGFGSETRPTNTKAQLKDPTPGPGHYDQARGLESYKPYDAKN
jgi:hypothetical protein